jgi:hypothetical protein
MRLLSFNLHCRSFRESGKDFCTPSSSKDTVRKHGGLLTFFLVLLLLRSIGNNDVPDILFTKDLLTSMILLVQWRYDSKSNR